MAWRCSGATNTDLISNLFKNGLITSPRVRDAMLKVDRAHYCPQPSTAYQDSPQPIGHNATISAPHMHASAAESLLPFLSPPASHPQRAVRVLDIGSGSGYLTHVLAVLAVLVGDGHDGRGGEMLSGGDADGGVGVHGGRDEGVAVDGDRRGGEVIGIEHIAELAALGKRNMLKSKSGSELVGSGRVRFVVGDGRRGWSATSTSPSPPSPSSSSPFPSSPPPGSPSSLPTSTATSTSISNPTPSPNTTPPEPGFDAIHVGAAAVTIHEELIQQLRQPGRMFIPVEDEDEAEDETEAANKKERESLRRGQHIWVVEKDVQGRVERRKMFGVQYVPLTGRPEGVVR